jgi:predicted DCC family thiol-disulfide oxidoreductase YuxK
MRVPSAQHKPGRHLILYDGVCGLCNRMNNFILARDPHGLFHFASLQSEVGRSLLLRTGEPVNALDTFYVVIDYRSQHPCVLSKAHAALYVTRQIGGIWRLSEIFGLLPDTLLNSVYDFIARHRYRIFGRYDICLTPKPEYKARFVDL